MSSARTSRRYVLPRPRSEIYRCRRPDWPRPGGVWSEPKGWHRRTGSKYRGFLQAAWTPTHWMYSVRQLAASSPGETGKETFPPTQGEPCRLRRSRAFCLPNLEIERSDASLMIPRSLVTNHVIRAFQHAYLFVHRIRA